MPRVRSSFTVNTSGPLAVLLALFALASPSDAGEAGEERISFERREFTLKETATFAPAVERYIIRGVLEIANREKVTYGKARDLFGQKSILVGYGDINSDATDEAFVFIDYGWNCADEGCFTFVYYKEDDLNWPELPEMRVQTDESGMPYLYLTPPDKGGYRDMNSLRSGLCWTGWSYISWNKVRKCPMRGKAPSTDRPR